MTMVQTHSSSERHGLLRQCLEFLRDFALFSGRRGTVGVLLTTLGALFEGIGLVMLIPLLTLVTNTGADHGRAATLALRLFERLGLLARLPQLALLLAIFAALMILRAVVISARDSTLLRLQIEFVEARRVRVTRQLVAARWDTIARLRHARVTHLLSGDIQQIGSAALCFQQCAVSAAMLAVQCLLAFMLSPMLACCILLALGIGALALLPVLRSAQNFGSHTLNTQLALTDSAAQFLGGLKLAVSQNLQSGFLAEFEQTLSGLKARQLEYQRRQTNRRLLISSLSALTGAIVVLVGFGMLGIAAAVVITQLLIIARMNGPVSQIQQNMQLLLQVLPAYQKVRELETELEAASPAQANSSRTPPTRLEGEIVFRDVGFAYSPADERGSGILRNLDLRIAPGSFIGITGASGTGKTTFADLLLGLFPPQTGQIAVGGTVLHGPALGAWRNQVSYVAQDPFLFHDTIRRNLLWVSPESSDAELWMALKVADAETMVRQMKLGLNTVMGERGSLVSGGERQRLALSRAILRKPRLLVLDEATNGIDVTAERKILTRLLALTPRLTIVMIAHRIESLSLCERVYVLECGRFVGERTAGKRDSGSVMAIIQRKPAPR